MNGPDIEPYGLVDIWHYERFVEVFVKINRAESPRSIGYVRVVPGKAS